jgi:hypothetical protein
VFLNSLAPDITEDIPVPLSGGGIRALETTGDTRFDISVNGLPFNLRIANNTPYRRGSEPVRKEQVDTSTDAGEQSLSTWWLRSQSSWHLGAGIRYYDPGAELETTYRFATSQGVDVWTQGQITLLNKMTEDQTGLTEPVYLSTFRSLGRDGWVSVSDDDLYWRGGEAPGGTLVRTNRNLNPRFRAASGPTWVSGGSPAFTETEFDVGGPEPQAAGYRKIETTAAGTWNMSLGDRSTSTANPVTGIAAGDVVTASVYAQADWTGAETIQAVMSVNWYDSGNALVQTSDKTEQLTKGIWKRIEQRPTRPSGGVTYRTTVRFESSGSIPIGGSARVGLGQVELGVELNPWFWGGQTDDADHGYAWTGTADASSSTDTYTPGVTRALPTGGATQPAPIGGSVWVGRTNGISKWDVDTDILTSPYTCTGVARCWWVKNRLFVAVGKDLYWVDHTTTGAIPGGAPNDVMLIASGVDDAWEWVDVSDTADAILLAGSGETSSSIFAVTVEDVAGVPEFTAAREVARLPQGEQATCMGSYLATFVVLGTTKGIRIAAAGDNGQISLGPLSVELDEGPIDVTFFDRFAYLPVSRALPDGGSGVVRVDLSEQIAGNRGQDTGLFPWNWDVYPVSVEDATSVAMNGNTGKVVLAHGGTVHVAVDELLEEGYLDSGAIRYRTTEMKDFQRARVSGHLNDGEVQLLALIDGQESSIYTYGSTTGLEGESTLNLPGGPLFAEMQFRLKLIRASEFVSPVVVGLTVKAMPSVTKSRLYEYPLSVHDREVTRHGHMLGYKGFGIDRVGELEALENVGAAIQIVDRRYNEAIVATIESLEFVNTDPPDGENDNGGGTVLMTVRVR